MHAKRPESVGSAVDSPHSTCALTNHTRSVRSAKFSRLLKDGWMDNDVGTLDGALVRAPVALGLVILAFGLSVLCANVDQRPVQGVDEPALVSCPHTETITALQSRVIEAETTLTRTQIDWTERMDRLIDAVGVGDVDVACLYRSHVLATHDGPPARAVRDKPVPGAWTPLSPHIVPPTLADCSARFGRGSATF